MRACQDEIRDEVDGADEEEQDEYVRHIIGVVPEAKDDGTVKLAYGLELRVGRPAVPVCGATRAKEEGSAESAAPKRGEGSG